MPRRTRSSIFLAATLLALPACAPAGMAPAPKPPATSRAEAPAWRPSAVEAAAVSAIPPEQARLAERRAGAFLGTAYLGAPLAGATVSMFDAAGKPVGTPFTTNPHGGFVVVTRDLPDWIELRSRGGTLDGKPFAGELRGVVDLTEVEGYRTSLGAASTLEAAYLRLRPGTSRAAALARAAAYLGLRPGLSPDATEQAIDGAAFLQAAQADPGGLAGFVDGMARAMQASPEARRPFVRAGHRSNAAAATTQDLVTKLTQGVLAGPGGTPFGATFAGMTRPAPIAAPSPASPAAFWLQQSAGQAVQDALRDDQIASLQAAVAGVSANVTAAVAILERQDSDAKWESYNRAYDKVSQLISRVKALEENYAAYLTHRRNNELPAAQTVFDYLIKPDLDQLTASDMNFFHDALMGPGGLIQLYSKAVVAGRPFYAQAEAAQMEAWWKTIDGVHTALIHMIIEKLEASPAGKPDLLAIRQDVFEKWLFQHRVPELKALKGVVSDRDVLRLQPWGSDTYTELDFIPEGYVYQPGARIVWSRRGVILKWAGEGTWPDQADLDAQNQSMALHGRPPYMWRTPWDDELKSMLAWDTSTAFVTNRLAKADFRRFDGMGVVANLRSPEVVMINQKWGSDGDPQKAYRAAFFDRGKRVPDLLVAAGGDSTALVHFYVSDWNPDTEPHWY